MQDYGHPCSEALQPSSAVHNPDAAGGIAALHSQDQVEQGLTAEQFLHLFIHWLNLYNIILYLEVIVVV